MIILVKFETNLKYNMYKVTSFTTNIHFVQDLSLSSVYDADNISAIFWEVEISHIARYKVYTSDHVENLISILSAWRARSTANDVL